MFKRVCRGIATLRVPEEANRTASLVGRKCRADIADVLSIDGCEEANRTASLVAAKSLVSDFEPIVYTVGARVFSPNGYSDDIRVECAPGIHFFLTRKEAEEY